MFSATTNVGRLGSVAACIFVLLLVGLYWINAKTSARPLVLKAWTKTKPYSADPMHYDAFVHHITFRPVFASLISAYRNGGYVGVLASKWRQSNNFQDWEFDIRPGLSFENGDPISPEVIAKNFNRVAFLKKSARSLSGLFEDLEGFAGLNAASGPIPGISFDQQRLRLRFTKPKPDLLEKISFGLYAIAHPSQFDPKTGAWLNERQAISSSAYRVGEWSENRFVLILRPEFPKELLHPNPFATIEIDFTGSSEAVQMADLVIAPSYDVAPGHDFEFHGPVNANIMFAKCIGWQDPSRLCGDLNRRRLMRQLFYRGLERSGYAVARSFLPLAINGVREFSDPADLTPAPLESGQVLKVPQTGTGLKATSNRDKQSIYEATMAGNQQIVAALNLKLEEVPYSAFRVGEDLPVDLSFQITGILAEQPREDLRFMFRSKHGAALPDADGRILAALGKDDFDPQVINQLIWDQAVVWPMMHFSYGYWVKKSSPLDLNEINLTLPPTDFQWLGWKR